MKTGTWLFLVSALLLAFLGGACGGKSDKDEGFASVDEDTADSEDTGSTSVPGTATGDPVGGGTLGDCSFVFVVDLIEGDADEGEITSCELVFELTDELGGVRSLKLTAPDGTAHSYPPPTSSEPVVEAADFLGEGTVDGKWTLVFDRRFDCEVITSVALEVEAEA